MAKKNKTTTFWVIGILLLVGVFAYNYGVFEGSFSVADLDSDVGQCSGGWTSFSIDDVQVNSQGRIRVTGVAKGSECMTINLKPSDLNNDLDDEGLEATRNIIGNIKLKKYTKTFPIDRTGKNFRTIKTATAGTIAWCSINHCQESGYSTTFDTYRTPSLKCGCIYYGASGIEGSFSSARSYGNFEVDFTLDGETETLSREQQSINIGNNHIEWVGNLMNLDEIYAPQYDARLIYSLWDLVEDGSYNTVQNLKSDFDNCMLASGGFNKVPDCIASHNTEVSNILKSKLEQYKTDNSNLIYDVSTDENNLYISLKATHYPAFILDLDAESVGIIALEGKPEITQCIQNQYDLMSGDNEVVNFKVKNNVDVDNVEFYSSITCNQGANAWSTNFNIDGLQTKTITAEINPVNPNQGDLSGTCSLKVTDLKSGNSDTCNFNIKVGYESGIICTPNELYCDDNLFNVLKCSSDGKNDAIFEKCDYGCVYEDGKAKCSGQPPIPDQIYCENCDAFAMNTIFGSLWEAKSCKPKFLQGNTTCVFSFIKLALVPIALIFGTLFGVGLFGKFKAIKKNKPVIWILSLLVALILAFLIYTLFWIGIIVLIIFGILRGVFK